MSIGSLKTKMNRPSETIDKRLDSLSNESDTHFKVSRIKNQLVDQVFPAV
jgi:hypothetical protein